MSESIPREPSAEHCIFSSQMRQMYLALMAEGFTTAEALTIIGQILAASVGKS